MAMLEMKAYQAFVHECSLCGARHVGGHMNEDPRTEQWFKEHLEWHKLHPGATGPPALHTPNGTPL